MGLTQNGLFAWLIVAGGLIGAGVVIWVLRRAWATHAYWRDRLTRDDNRVRVARGNVRRHVVRLLKQGGYTAIGLAFTVDPLPLLPPGVRSAQFALLVALVLVAEAMCALDALMDLRDDVTMERGFRGAGLPVVSGGRRSYDPPTEEAG